MTHGIDEPAEGGHPALGAGGCAIVTGAASGIGLAIAARCAALGMKVGMIDLPSAPLDRARESLIAGGAAPDALVALPADVRERGEIDAAVARARRTLGPVRALFANAGIQPGSSVFDADGTWDRIIDTNLLGIVRTVQAIVPGMIEGGEPGLVVATGSKQGITTPPGDPAYNVAKAGVKVFAEALQHDLRNRPGCRVEARLFVPGFVFTPLTANGRTTKPDAAWTPEETVAFLFAALARDEFYILCPDGEVDRTTDERRIRWAAGDIVENRPPLSRWHPGFADAFARAR